MSAVPLLRDGVRELFKMARCDAHATHPHPGLLLQRGLPEHDRGKPKLKSDFLADICKHGATGCFYRRAYNRWRKLVLSDEQRFSCVKLALRSRLFIALTGSGMLETGCAISHSTGAPYIPGSSIKGVVRTHALERLGATAERDRICEELFGAPATEEQPAGLSGLIAFHDAWWVPDSASTPFIKEIVASHHPNYYGGGEDRQHATDFDSPVPNAQIAVQGAFLFALESNSPWLKLTGEMLEDALCSWGIGAKTRAGYGLFARPGQETCSWVDGKLQELSKRHNAQREDTLRGKGLAEEWRKIEELQLKSRALADIRRRWEEKGWWDSPPSKSARKVKSIYEQAMDA